MVIPTQDGDMTSIGLIRCAATPAPLLQVFKGGVRIGQLTTTESKELRSPRNPGIPSTFLTRTLMDPCHEVVEIIIFQENVIVIPNYILLVSLVK